MSEKYEKLARDLNLRHDIPTDSWTCRRCGEECTYNLNTPCRSVISLALELAALEARIDEATKCATMPYFSIIDEVTELVTKREELEKR